MQDNSEKIKLPFDQLTLNNNNMVSFQIDHGKESFYNKFDPLCWKTEKNNQSNNFYYIESDIGYDTGSLTSVSDQSIEKLTSMCSKNKPLRVVPPIQTCEKPLNISETGGVTLPILENVPASAIYSVTTDTLINFSGNTSALPATSSIATEQLINYSSNTNRTISGFHSSPHKNTPRKLFTPINLLQDRGELYSQETETTSLMTRDLILLLKKLKTEKDFLIKSTKDLNSQLIQKTLSNKQMCIVIEEYEKVICNLITEQKFEKTLFKENVNKLQHEHKEALSHLDEMEATFTDLLSKYEKCKLFMLEQTEREKMVIDTICQRKDDLKMRKIINNKLNQMSSSELAKSEQLLSEMDDNHNTEITRLNAITFKHDIKIASLQDLLNLKIRDNEKLSSIYDKLINKLK